MTYIFRFNDPRGNYTAWEFKHVESISMNFTKSATVVGLPTKSSMATQVFDMAGAVRKFSITFTRFDYEEDVSNWDFLYTKNNRVGNKIYKGLDWFTSQMQVTRPYRFQIAWKDEGDGEDPGQLPTGTWNVSVTGVSYDVDNSTFGMGTFTLDLTERRG